MLSFSSSGLPLAHRRLASVRSGSARSQAYPPLHAGRTFLAGCLAGLPLVAAWAEDPSAAAGPAYKLPLVVVSGKNEPDNAQNLPASDTVVARTMLDEAGVRSVNDAAGYAPNTFLNEFTARKLSNPFFRGLGGSPGNPAVTTYLDGVPQLNSNSSSLELVDVDEVEFVRGPQAALFGRNTVGGLISLTSTRPSTQEWTGGLTGTYGNYNLHDVRLSASGPLVPGQVGLGLGLGYSARDGYTRNDVTGHWLDSRDAYFSKAQLLFTPWQDWEARLIVNAERARDGDYALGDLSAIRANPHHVSRDFEGYTHRDVFAPTLLVNHTGSAVDFDMTTGLVWWKTRDLTDLDYTVIPAVTRDDAEKDFQFTEELRLSSAKDSPLSLGDSLKLKWQTGASVFTQGYQQTAQNYYSPGILYPANALYPPGTFGPGTPGSPPSPAETQTSPFAKLDDVGVGAYAQGVLTAWERLDLIAGLRGDYEDKKANLGTFYSPANPVLGAPVLLNATRDFSEVSPKFGLAYRLSPEETLYATVARGYKAGGFNPVAPAGSATYGTESSWNYEVGAKARWMDGRLSVKVAAFYLDWSRLQLNLPTGAQGGYYVSNAGAAASKGLELELTARVCSGMELFGGVGYSDARFLNGATAIHTDALGNNSTIQVGGNHLINTPDFTANLGSQYSVALCHAATFYARAEVIAYGNYAYNPANTAGQSAYSLANFRAGVRGKHWFAEGWVRNAFDSHYVPVAFEFPNGALGGSGFVGESGAPVTFGATAGVRF